MNYSLRWLPAQRRNLRHRRTCVKSCDLAIQARPGSLSRSHKRQDPEIARSWKFYHVTASGSKTFFPSEKLFKDLTISRSQEGRDHSCDPRKAKIARSRDSGKFFLRWLPAQKCYLRYRKTCLKSCDPWKTRIAKSRDSGNFFL